MGMFLVGLDAVAAGFAMLLVVIGLAFVDFGGWLLGIVLFALVWKAAGRWQKASDEVYRARTARGETPSSRAPRPRRGR